MKFDPLACLSWHQWSLLGKLFLVYLPHKWCQKLYFFWNLSLFHSFCLFLSLKQTVPLAFTDLLTSSETNWALTFSQTVPHACLKQSVLCASPNQTVSCTTPKRKVPCTWNNTSPQNKLYFTFLPTKPSHVPRALPNKLYLALLLTNLYVCASTYHPNCYLHLSSKRTVPSTNQTVNCTSHQNKQYLALPPTKLSLASLPNKIFLGLLPTVSCNSPKKTVPRACTTNLSQTNCSLRFCQPNLSLRFYQPNCSLCFYQ